MEWNVTFRRKEAWARAEACVVERAIELPREQFDSLCQDLLRDQPFITENKDAMHIDERGERHCLLVLGAGRDDGLIIDAQGYDYPRYTAHIPCARQLWALEQYQPLADYVHKMAALADRYVRQAAEEDGPYRILMADFEGELKPEQFDSQLLADMLRAHPELETECASDELIVRSRSVQEQDSAERSDPALSM